MAQGEGAAASLCTHYKETTPEAQTRAIIKRLAYDPVKAKICHQGLLDGVAVVPPRTRGRTKSVDLAIDDQAREEAGRRASLQNLPTSALAPAEEVGVNKRIRPAIPDIDPEAFRLAQRRAPADACLYIPKLNSQLSENMALRQLRDVMWAAGLHCTLRVLVGKSARGERQLSAGIQFESISDAHRATKVLQRTRVSRWWVRVKPGTSHIILAARFNRQVVDYEEVASIIRRLGCGMDYLLRERPAPAGKWPQFADRPCVVLECHTVGVCNDIMAELMHAGNMAGSFAFLREYVFCAVGPE